jgi:hypothetical protein
MFASAAVRTCALQAATAISTATPASPAVAVHRVDNVVIGSTSMFERPPELKLFAISAGNVG